MFKKILKILLIVTFPLIVIFIFNKIGLLYGSKTDWINQHIIFADYFRESFYKTGNILPSFSLNIGAGQNIFNFAYYGLLNPIILLSYLLPFIDMNYYITYTIILSVIISFVLIKKWLINNDYDNRISLIIAILFILSGPIIFHTHRHIMFINYFPFLILGLMGIDKYYKDKKSWLLIISIFMIIMTSYYYSICALITLFSYALYKYLKDNNIINYKDILIYLIKTFLIFLTGILLASFFLLPIIGVILSGRGDVNQQIDIINLITPNFNVEAILYDSYSIGLTIIALLAIIYSFISKKKENILLSIIILILTTIPIFMYVLNGGLYIRAKVFIPLIPLALLLISDFLKSKDFKKNKLILFAIFIIGVLFKYDNILFYIDIILLIIFLHFYTKSSKKIIYMLLFLIPIINVYIVNKNEGFVSIKEYNNYFNIDEKVLINNTLNNDQTFYRFNNLNNPSKTINKVYNMNYYNTSIYSSTYNNNYNNFYYNVFGNSFPDRNLIMLSESSNILFQTYMGVKYIVSSDIVPIGYKLIEKKGNIGLYQNENVFPLGYVMTETISYNEFNDLKYPYNVEMLLSKVVIDNNTETIQQPSKIKEVSLEYEVFKGDDIEIEKDDNTIMINSHNNSDLILNLKEPINNQILIISFDMLEDQSCKQGDLGITINNIKNTLTCKDWIYRNNNYTFNYVISSNEDISKLEINFNKGLYKINNIKTYLLDYNEVKEQVSNIDQFNVDISRTKSNYIAGDITVNKEGYFVLNIPYDKGFTIKVNNKIVKYEKVNESFIGFPIEKGKHNIEIEFKTPLLKEGILLTIVGLGLFIFNLKKEIVLNNSIFGGIIST